MPDRERKRVPDDSPQASCTPLGHRKFEYLRLNREKEKENRDEATQRGIEELYQRRCGAGESYFVLNLAANRQPMEIKE